MTLMIAIAMRENVVLTADNLATRQVLDPEGFILQQEPFVSEKIWLLDGRLAVSSCGSASINVPTLMGQFVPTQVTIEGCTFELIDALRHGAVPNQPWFLYIAGVERQVARLYRANVPDRIVTLLNRHNDQPVFRGWAEGLQLPELPMDTDQWTVEQALRFSNEAICAAALAHPGYVGPPIKSIVASPRGLRWASDMGCEKHVGWDEIPVS